MFFVLTLYRAKESECALLFSRFFFFLLLFVCDERRFLDKTFLFTFLYVIERTRARRSLYIIEIYTRDDDDDDDDDGRERLFFISRR